MKRLPTVTGVLMTTLVTLAAVAEGSGIHTLVSAVQTRADGKFLVTIPSLLQGNQPGCVTQNHSTLAGDVSTAAGRAMLDVALHALIHKKSVNVRGTGTCSNVVGIESLTSIQIQ
jgi:hypothetical protein